jgi:hypothetical protein
MAFDRSFVELNRVSTERMRALAARLDDLEMQHPVGPDWTVAIALAHMAFWDRRVLFILDATERDGQPLAQDIDVVVNDLALPLWAAIPPREAARIALEAAQAVDKRLEDFPPALLEALLSRNKRWVVRALHRNEHLDEIDSALKG